MKMEFDEENKNKISKTYTKIKDYISQEKFKIVNPKEAEGLGGIVSIIAIPIPTYNLKVEWDEFREQMKKTEKEFIEKLRKEIGV